MKENRKKQAPGVKGANHPAFGIWADREDMKDVHAWLKKIRTPRYLRDVGSLLSQPSQESTGKPKP